MRTMRLSLVGAAVLALVGTSAVSVAAQPEQEIGTGPEFAWVASVIETNCWQDGSQTTGGGDEDGHSWFRDLKYGCDLEASDPRVSGTLRGTFGDDCFGETDDTCVFWNSEEITGPDGSWTGWVWGTHRPEQPGGQSLMTLLKVFAGHGAYDGLTFLLHGVGPLGGELDFNGIVYEGYAPPPLGELPFTMPSEEPLAAAEVIEAEPVEEPSEEGAATEGIAVEEPVVADEEEADTAGDDDEDLSGTAVYIDGLRTWQYWEGDDTIYELEMSDPRANGTYTEWGATIVGNGYDSDSQRPSIVGLMEVSLVNDEGSWSGLQSAVWDDDMGWRLTAWLAGEDAHEGLTLYLHAHRFPVYSTPEMEFDGVIFEGDSPVMLEAVDFPTD